MASWQRDAASGLVILVPILLTLYIVYWIGAKIAAIPLFPFANPLVRVVVTVVVFVLLVFAIGYLMRTAIGAILERTIDNIINQVPVLRVVYNASKMAVDTATSGTDELQQPVKLDVWDDLRMTAFKTGKTTDDGREILFLPTSPNITTGFVIEVEPENLTETGERVEEALTRVLSAGFGEETDSQSVPIPVQQTDDD